MKRGCLLIALIIFLIAYTSAETTITGEVTGKATAQNAGINISVVAIVPSLTIINPENKTYLTNESLLLNYSSSNALFIWYNLDNSTNITITSFTYFNTSQGSHILYLYANNSDGNLTSRNITFIANSTRFVINYDEYNDPTKGSSTNFIQYTYEDIQNLSSIILENTNYGKILFNQLINLTNDANPTDNTLDLDSNINVSSNRIELNASALPNFNISSTLWLYNLTFSNPRILRDGSLCPSTICTQENYSSGTLKFNVTSFSVYSAEETPTEAPSPTPSAGGGGGGGGGLSIIKKFTIDKKEIKITLKQGETKYETIEIKNTGNTRIKIELSMELEEFIKIENKSFYLEAGKSIKITLDFLARENAVPDLYIEKLIVDGEGIKKEILIALEVESKEPLFDVEVEIPRKYQQVLPGEEILVNIKLYSLGKEGRVDVKIEYIIKDEKGKTIVSKEETIAVETQTSFVKEIKIPENAKFGNYFFYVKATYNSQTASSSEMFYMRKPVLSKENLIYLAIVIFITVLIFILYELRKMRKHFKTHIKIDENILAKEGIIKRR